MNLCPFCNIEFLSEEELSAHIYQEHPEKTSTAEAIGQALGQSLSKITNVQDVQDTMRLAAQLTSIALGNRGVDLEKVEEVFKHFLEFLRLLGQEKS